MAALTDEQYQSLIVAEIGDDDNGTLAANVPLYWLRYDDIAHLETRYLYAKRAAIVLMLGTLRDAVDRSSGGDSVKESQAFDHLITMRDEIDATLTAAASSASGGGGIGTLAKTAPIMPPAGSTRDANDTAYRGDPYRPRRG